MATSGGLERWWSWGKKRVEGGRRGGGMGRMEQTECRIESRANCQEIVGSAGIGYLKAGRVGGEVVEENKLDEED